MTFLTRLGRYARAMTGLGELDRITFSLKDKPRELIRQIFQYGAGFLDPIQLEDEIEKLAEDVGRLQPATVVEIGTRNGGTLYLWTRLAQPDAVIVSIDLPGGQFGGGYSSLRTPFYRRFARERQKIHLLRANSHDPSTRAKLTGVLGGRSIDFLFIDGDHTYGGVKQDWEMYAPMVRPGGLIAFHDISSNYKDIEVKKLWDTIKTGYDNREYVADPGGYCGIGVLVHRAREQVSSK